MRSLLALAALGPTLAPAAAAPIPEASWSPGSSSIREAEVIPPAYRGRWALNPAACVNPVGMDSIEVLAHGVDADDSGGRLERVTQAGPERAIKLRLSYEGEGSLWETIEIWTLNEAGDRLTTASEDAAPNASTIALTRCP
jgi:hypothetical protein